MAPWIWELYSHYIVNKVCIKWSQVSNKNNVFLNIGECVSCPNLKKNHEGGHFTNFIFISVLNRPHNNRRHRRPMASGAPTDGLGAIESSLLFCYSLTCNGLGALSCSFKMALKMGALRNPYFEAWSWIHSIDLSSYIKWESPNSFFAFSTLLYPEPKKIVWKVSINDTQALIISFNTIMNSKEIAKIFENLQKLVEGGDK